MKVCWQVTGVRKDRWAEANPMEIEEVKAGEKRGRYLHPELYDEPEERSFHRAPAIPEKVGRRLEEESMRRIEQLPPQAQPLADVDFARLEGGHRRQMEESRRRMQEMRQRMEQGDAPPEAT